MKLKNEKQQTECFMFDTTVFNDILDKHISIDRLNKGFRYFAAHIQYDQLNDTSESLRRTDLLKVFNLISSESISTESSIVGVSRVGRSKLGKGTRYHLILNKQKRKAGNIKDALIAEAAINNGYVLVTDDKRLLKMVPKCSGEAITLTEFLARTAPAKKIMHYQLSIINY